MEFPDQIYIDKIREALWRYPKPKRGIAAVMIGSGFSRNARPISVSSGQMSTWADLSRELSKRLHLDDLEIIERKFSNDSRNAESGANIVLTLAQNYEEIHGRDSLNKFIRDFTPDYDYEPSQLHEKLLKLNWADVFTTNWDTLLERACKAVTEQHYHVVPTINEIPGSSQPRIVKLHGSFPSNLPFIFTEKDFDEYPMNFAPFVNFVQQAMMENVFCLIGFSGDDPNFKRWVDWVRVNLGKNAPKIYFVGFHDMSPEKRQELEKLNITPIDLAHIPGCHEWPITKKHQWSIEWFLENLERAEPWFRSDWPQDKRRKTYGQARHLTKIPGPPGESPKKEYHSKLNHRSPIENRIADTREMILVWEHNRSLYPGWVVAPSVVRALIWHETQNAMWDIIRCFPHLQPWERLFFLREIIWRINISLMPLFGDLHEKISNVLIEVDPIAQQCRTGGKLIEWPKPDWPNAIDAWIELGMVLAGYYREEGMAKEFGGLAALLEKHATYNDNIGHFLIYQRALMARDRLDYKRINKVLDQWDPKHTDHLWVLRKAALLGEVNRADEARSLCQVTLEQIRQSTRKDIDDIAMLSREGWAMYVLQEPFAEGEQEKWASRWDELAIYQCDARGEFATLSQELDRGPKEYKETTVERGFDLGHSSTMRNFPSGGDYLPAYQMIRLTDVAGIPPITYPAQLKSMPLSLSSHTLKQAANWLKRTDIKRAMRLVMRVCEYDSDKILEQVFCREIVALIPVSEVEDLVVICKSVIEQSSLPVIKKGDDVPFWIGRLRVALEIQSRLVVRLSTQEAKSIFHLALKLNEEIAIRGHLWLVKPLFNIINRSIGTIGLKHIEDLFLILMKMPTGDYADRTAEESWLWLNYNSEEITRSFVKIRQKNIEGWQRAIKQLIKVTSVSEDRSRAIKRINFLYRTKNLTEAEKKLFARALWKKDLLAENGLPDGTDLYPWVFLFMPEPKSGFAERQFRQAFFSPKHSSRFSLPDYLHYLGESIRSLQNQNMTLTLAPQEEATIKGRINEWIGEIEEPEQRTGFLDHPRREEKQNAIKGVGALLPSLKFSDSEIDAILERVKIAEKNGYSCLSVYVALLTKRSSIMVEIVSRFRGAIVSPEKWKAHDALDELGKWIDFASKGTVHHPPDDLISEASVAIYIRRQDILTKSLFFAGWMFIHHQETAKRLLQDRVLHGLSYLLAETRYDIELLAKTDPTFDIPLVRKACVELALVIQKANVKNPTLDEWIQLAKEDPLPEVRHLVDC